MTNPNPVISVDSTAALPARVFSRVNCESCHRGVELECEGRPGFWGYETYNAYFCPHCRRQNHARTSGAVVLARAA
jgi:hypothetical protein